MSVTTWALSGNPLEEAVVSTKTGHVFEKRVIHKHIDNTGQCPITGVDLEKKDLIDLKVERVTKPKALGESGIPGMITKMQSEWDAVVLETYELRKHLEIVRKNLAHALYQHDAAWRVISRLTQERDEARQALALTQEKLQDYKGRLGVGDATMKEKESTSKLKEETKQAVVETENSGIYPELQEKLNTLSEKLFNARKEHKKPEGYIKGTDFSTLTEKNSYPFHSTTTPGAASVDISKKNPNILCSGGNDGSTIIFDKTSGKVTHNFGDNSNSSPVNGVEFMDSGVLLSKANGSAEYWAVDLVSQTSTHRKTIQGQAGIIASSHPLNPYVIHGTGSNSWGFFNIETGAKLFQTELKDGMDLTSLRVHPDGLMVATGSSTGVVNLWDIRTQSCAAVMEGINSPITRLEFSEKAIHLAGSSDKSNIAGLWNLKKFKKPPQKLIHQQGSVVRSIAFDPYGAFVVSASDKTLCFFDSSNTETCLFELPAHEDVINDVSFALDASYLATASADRTVKLFQL